MSLKNSGIKEKIHALCVLSFNELSATEEAILCCLMPYSLNGNVLLSVDISRQIKEDLNLSQSLLSTSLFRLQQKNIIKKQGKTITLNPVFNNIQELKEIRIKFE